MLRSAEDGFYLFFPHPTPHTLHPTPYTPHPSQALLFDLDGGGGVDGRGGITRGNSLTVLTIKTVAPDKKALVGAIIG